MRSPLAIKANCFTSLIPLVAPRTLARGFHAFGAGQIDCQAGTYTPHKNAASSGVVTMLPRYIVDLKKHAGLPFFAILHRLVLG